MLVTWIATVEVQAPREVKSIFDRSHTFSNVNSYFIFTSLNCPHSLLNLTYSKAVKRIDCCDIDIEGKQQEVCLSKRVHWPPLPQAYNKKQSYGSNSYFIFTSLNCPHSLLNLTYSIAVKRIDCCDIDIEGKQQEVCLSKRVH
jgi:hypothetical protein